jgi:predicted neutral ceramidase superfamily lipid hydrolase
MGLKVVIECFVIILILVIAGYMFVRSKRKAWFYGIFPLMLVPAINIILYSLGKDFLSDTDDTFFIRSAIYVISFFLTSVWVLLWARTLPFGKSKYAYIICTISYTLVLCLLLLFKGPHLR